MAEFVEVMRIAKRICDKYENDLQCNGCPINGSSGCIFFDSMYCDDDYYPKVDKIVVDWAKEHPEQVYPSWEDAWKQMFPNGIDVPCPSEYDAKYGIDCLKFSCKNCKKRPIPAEVAGKLGIKPKEV